MTNLSQHITKQEEEIKEQRRKLNAQNKNLRLLKQIEGLEIPLEIISYSDGRRLLSSNYSLATDVEIKKRGGSHPCKGGFSCYDGGYDYDLYEWYPQFYFDLKIGKKKEKVYLTHEGFDRDENIVLRSVEKCHGWGDYSDHTRQTDERIDSEIAYEFFRKKGVKEELIEETKRKLKVLEELS